MRIVWSGFVGLNQAQHPRLIADQQSVMTYNQRPGFADFRPWNQPLTVAQASAAGRQAIYRFGKDVASDTTQWVTFSDAVSIMPGFDTEDTSETTFVLGPSGFTWFDNTMLGANGAGPLSMRSARIPAPTAAPVAVVTINGGTGTDETWNYVTTFVTTAGWESAPSPPSADVLVKPGGVNVTLNNFEAPPAGNYGITRRRVYKSLTGTSGTAAFFLLVDLPIATQSFVDTGPDIGNNETLATRGWRPLPDGAHHLTPLWNGMAAALVGKTARICEANVAYAWPLAYEIQFEHTAVACAAYQQSLIVGTTGQPYIVSGLDPLGMGASKLEIEQACIAPRSMVSVGHGVVWASPDGLVYTGTAGTKMLTSRSLSREAWQALGPEDMIGAFHDGLYFAILPGRGGFAVDPANPTGIYPIEGLAMTSAFVDAVQDALFVLEGVNIRKFNAGASPMAARARSKVWTSQVACSFAAAGFVGDGPATLRVLADGVEQAVQDLQPFEAMRLPGDSTYNDWQIEIVQSSAPIQGVVLATSVKELFNG